MKNTILLFLFLSMGNFFYSQDNIRVEYSFKIPSTSYIYNSYLEVSPEASYFEINNKAITEDQTIQPMMTKETHS